MMDLLRIANLLTPAQCQDWLAQLELAGAAPAQVLDNQYGGRVAPQMRRAARLQPPPALHAQAMDLLQSLRPQLQDFFDVTLGHCEPAQFLRYETGDFFVAHQDGNTPLLRDASLTRRVSVILLLNAAADASHASSYGGGELLFHPRGGGVPCRELPAAGSLLAFRAETTHEVLPVVHGRRYSVASWFHGE